MFFWLLMTDVSAGMETEVPAGMEIEGLALGSWRGGIISHPR
jgi:hypothetical protein